ncbi:MAG: DUF3572 domain-containing protein [Sneathiellaceae bacterium]
MPHGSAMSRDDAETLALTAFTWVLGDDELRDRFLAMTGFQAEDMRENLGNPAFLAGVLDWLLAHEATLLRFCAASGAAPEHPAQARQALRAPAPPDGGRPRRPPVPRNPSRPPR